jgi:hypothetical protein
MHSRKDEIVSENGDQPSEGEPFAIIPKVFKLYTGPPTLNQAAVNLMYILWTPRPFPDLNKAIEAARQIDLAGVEVSWIIECPDGQRLERDDIIQRYPP